MSSNFTSDFPNEYVVAGVFMTALGILGVCINITVVLALIRTSLFNNAFGYICTLHLISNAGELLVFSLWNGPATIWQLDPSVTDTFFGSRIAQFYFIFWFCALYSDLQLAVNRFVAIEWPLMYNKTFAGRGLAYFIGSFCILSVAHALVFSTYDCSLWFDPTIFMWRPRPTTCGHIAVSYTVLAHVVGLCALIFIIDTITFCCIWKKAKNLRYSNGMKSEHERRMLRKNISFYVQGCLQSIVLLFATVSQLVLSNFASTRLQIFLTTSLNWELAYMSYSVILVLFNKPLRKILPIPHFLLRKQSKTNTARLPPSHALAQLTHEPKQSASRR